MQKQLSGGETKTPLVSMSGIEFAWPGRDAFTLRLSQFTLASRERLLLIGPSGSGKSTFLSLLCGIVQPQHGRINIIGTDLSAMAGAARDRFRGDHFGIIFQMFNLLPYGTIMDNVLLPLNFSARRRKRVGNDKAAEAEATRLLDCLGLDARQIAGKSANALSVGQQQRVAAARALIGAPEIIVADEPTSALDRNRQTQFLDLLFAEVAAAGSGLIMVSHDESLAPKFDRVISLSQIAETA